MNERTERSLVGSLGGAGLVLVLAAFFNYMFYPSWQKNVWGLNLTFGLMGAAFITLAIFIRVKHKKNYSSSRKLGQV
jgi:hypothetical protein